MQKMDPKPLADNLLQRFTAKARKMSDGELVYALGDINKTLPLYRDTDPNWGYHAKLLAEWDAYSVEVYNRRNRIKR